MFLLDFAVWLSILTGATSTEQRQGKYFAFLPPLVFITRLSFYMVQVTV